MSSRWLASSLVVAYAGVSAAVGIVLLNAPKDPVALDAPAITYVDVPPPGEATPRQGSGPSRVSLPAPAGFQRVTGPAGLVTAIPAGWLISRATGPGALQATDPTDPLRYLRFGGSPAPADDLLRSHEEYEARFSPPRRDYQRLSLGTAAYRGTTAVDWEFEHETAEGPRTHVRSMYWRAGGVEYFIYAASPATRWAETAPIYSTMIAQSTTP
ncbi:hypothetical protein ACOBQX_11640 [Actinokineospora sp. G85]|uniref:hypothetical protein n=1 Tax=Actinokineospora sp. G85 TaxID=3406626 RepID=UPI003C7207E2